MSARGRSRAVSPLAVVHPAAVHHAHLAADLEVAFLAKTDLPPHNMAPIPTVSHREAIYLDQPVASSSRLDPCPSFSCSHSSASSTSSDHTPAPATPPALPVDLYPARYRSPSFDYYESPPSPPRTLQDQMHVAYAHDNMHLAKILLLRLQGIDITDDADPRIALVKDEDFSAAFVPRGGLVLDPARERLCQESEAREKARRRARARDARLQACEQRWDAAARALQSEKTKTARRKEAAAAVRRHVELREKERQRSRRPVRATSGTPRPVLSYDALPSLRTRAPPAPAPKAYDGPLYDYPYEATPPTPPRTTARSVPFRDVLAAMHGPLFPAEDPPIKGKATPQQILLQSLLHPDDEAPTITLTPASSTSSVRGASWFSFSSRSSASTAITTPPSSPLPSFTALPGLTPVSLADAPLAFPAPSLPSPSPRAVVSRPPTPAPSLAARLGASLSLFLTHAARFQRAYVKAAAHTADPGVYFPTSRSPSRSRSRSRVRDRPSGVRKAGYRALSTEVEVFLTFVPVAEPHYPARPLLPLGTTPAPARVFTPPAPIPRSPFRPSLPPSSVQSRLRPVANPLLLRLRALQNAAGVRVGLGLEEVREKVVGVAWEGIGRSGLGREVRVFG